MFIAVLFTIAKIWKQPKCASVDGWIKKTVVYLRSSKKEGSLSFDSMSGNGNYYAKWNKPVGERQIPYDLTYKWNLMNKINLTNKNRIRNKEQTAVRGVGVGGDWLKEGEGIVECTHFCQKFWGKNKDAHYIWVVWRICITLEETKMWVCIIHSAHSWQNTVVKEHIFMTQEQNWDPRNSKEPFTVNSFIWSQFLLFVGSMIVNLSTL